MSKIPRASTQSTKNMAMELFRSSSAEPFSGRTGSGIAVEDTLIASVVVLVTITRLRDTLPMSGNSSMTFLVTSRTGTVETVVFRRAEFTISDIVLSASVELVTILSAPWVEGSDKAKRIDNNLKNSNILK